MVRVSAFAPYPSPAPSTYFRLEQFVGPLAARGVELEILPFVGPDRYETLYSIDRWQRARVLRDGWRRRAGTIERGALAPIVLVQRELAPLGAHALLARLIEANRALVFDFDDAVYLPSPGGERLLRWVKHPERDTAALCRAADAVWSGNTELDRFAQRQGSSATKVVPTVVDTDLYRPREGTPAGLPVIGWVGSHTSLPYLESLYPALSALKRRVGFRLRVVCNQPPAAPPADLDLDFEAWRPERRVAAVQGFDIGVYPVVDDAWARGKCGLKAIEYGACGIPVVCPPVGVLSEVVTDEVTGLHVREEQDWVRHLERLLRDTAIRRRFGRAGRERVERGYSVHSVVDRMATDLKVLSPEGS